MKEITSIIRDSTSAAIRKNILRPNAVDIVTDASCENAVGIDFPVIYFEEYEKKGIEMDLLLKGAGSENIGATYSLPDARLKAERDFNGVKKCVIDACVKSQGKGCPPYIISIALGGSRDVVSRESKKGLLRKLDDINPVPALAKLEQSLLEEANMLQIGPMGFGGPFTAVAVKIASFSRHPASYFVDICFSCWALRRGKLLWKE